MSEALKRQVNGTHYLNMGMQPIQFAMANGWDAGAFSILKYVSRHRSKNGKQDVEKGLHFVELRFEFIDHVVVPDEVITMADYIGKNGFDEQTAGVLRALDIWVRMPSSDYYRTALEARIQNIIAEYVEQEKQQAALDFG